MPDQWDFTTYDDPRITGSDRRGLHLRSGASILRDGDRAIVRPGRPRGRHCALRVRPTVAAAFRLLVQPLASEPLRVWEMPPARERALWRAACGVRRANRAAMFVIVESNYAGHFVSDQSGGGVWDEQSEAVKVRNEWQEAADEAGVPVMFEVYELRKVG